MAPNEGTKREFNTLPKMRTDSHDPARQNAFALVTAAILQQPLQLGAIRRFCALAFFGEARQDLKAFASAVLLADLKLRTETEVRGLLVSARADATVLVGLTSVDDVRPSYGFSFGYRPAAVGFEIEYLSTMAGDYSAGGIFANLIVQPVTISKVQIFAVGGVGEVSKEEVGAIAPGTKHPQRIAAGILDF